MMKFLGKEADKLPAFFMSSAPKSGTHLLKQALLGIPGIIHCEKNEFYVDYYDLPSYKEHFYQLSYIQPNEFGAGHVYYSPEWSYMLKRLGMKHFFISRDLRDIVVSFTYFIVEKYPSHPLYDYLTKELRTQNQRYQALIQGVDKDQIDYPDLAEWFGPFFGWMKDPNTFALTFEDLVISKESRLNMLTRLANYLWQGLTPPVSISQMVNLMDTNIDPTKSFTFRKGEIGDWKNEFDEETKAVFKKIAGNLLIALGYEKDDNW